MTAGRRAGPRRLVPVLAALALAAAGAGCSGPPPATPPIQMTPVDPSAAIGPSPTSPAEASLPAGPTGSAIAARRHGLLLLAGRPGAMALELIEDHGERRPVPLPDPSVAWLSSSLDGRLLATTLDGRAFLSDAILGDASPTWHRLAVAGIGPTALARPPSFGSLAPDGSRAALVAGDFGTSAPSDILIVPVDGSAGSVVRIHRPADGAPPGWIDRRVIVLSRTQDDRVGSTILDLVDGTQTEGPGPVAAPGPAGMAGWIEPIAGLSIAADGSRLAVASAEDGRIEVHPADAWLARADTTPEPVELVPERDGSRSYAWLGLSASGDRLAVVRTNFDGDAVAVTLHDRALGWAQGRRIALPVGADRAVVAWLP